jgi:sugar diacid utilization regulator
VIRRLDDRRDDLVAAILEAMHALPEYSAIDDPMIWDEIRQHTLGSVRLSLSALRTGDLPGDDELETAVFFAHRRAEQGLVSLRALRSAYVKGVGILWDSLVREARGERTLRDEILERSSWMLRYLDFLTSAVADAYHEAQKGSSRRRDQRTRDLFDEIIDGEPADTEALEARARLAGVDSASELRAIVLRGPTDATGHSAFSELPPVPILVACADSAGVSVERVAAARRGSELLLVLPSPDGNLGQLCDALGTAMTRMLGEATTARAGVSGPTGSGGLRRAYRECARAIELGELVSPASPVHCYDDYLLHDVFDSTAAQGERLIAQALGPLLEVGEDGDKLLRTLAEYFRSGFNHKLTAIAVGIHRNTLTHRLQQIQDLLEVDLEEPAVRLRVDAALRFLEIRRLRDA